MSNAKKGAQMWWRVSKYFNLGKIEALPVVKETAQFVTYLKPAYGGETGTWREGKNTEYYLWLPTEAEAIARARNLLRDQRDRYRERLKSAEAALADFNAAHPED